MSNLYPWQAFVWEKLNHAREQDRLSHGVLLSAKRGTGARLFAERWAQQLLCRQPKELPCGQCKSCQLFEKGTHPDFHWIEVLEDKKQISIEQIRRLTEAMHESANLDGWRVAVIFEAEKLTINGYNALLKTLEEPGKNTHLMLVAADRSAIPATIISRCQHFPVQPESLSMSLDWLQSQLPNTDLQALKFALTVTHNAPIAALAFIEEDTISQFESVISLLQGVLEGSESPLAISEFKSVSPELLLEWWEIMVSQLIQTKASQRTPSHSYGKMFAKLAESSDERLLFKLRDNILFQLKELREGISLNLPMQLDGLAQQWKQCRVPENRRTA